MHCSPNLLLMQALPATSHLLESTVGAENVHAAHVGVGHARRSLCKHTYCGGQPPRVPVQPPRVPVQPPHAPHSITSRVHDHPQASPHLHLYSSPCPPASHCSGPSATPTQLKLFTSCFTTATIPGYYQNHLLLAGSLAQATGCV